MSLQFDHIQNSHEMIEKPLLKKVKIVFWETIASNMNTTLQHLLIMNILYLVNLLLIPMNFYFYKECMSISIKLQIKKILE